jgi:hypothetical protein
MDAKDLRGHAIPIELWQETALGRELPAVHIRVISGS